ncbi:MAG: autotransporter domain-containing protein [Dongiaceae bacterium]
MTKRVRWTGLAILLCEIGLAGAAAAQDATWRGVTSDFNAPFNWLPAAVPTGTAAFAGGGQAAIGFSSGTLLGSLSFGRGAPAFSFGSTSESAGMSLAGSGIVNAGAPAPRFAVSNGGAVAAAPGLAFLNAASAGNARIANRDGGVTAFLGTATAADSVISNSGGSAPFSGTVFIASSTAGNASITNTTSGITQFNQTTTAGRATLVNNGGSLAGFDIARFIDAVTRPGGPPQRSDVAVTAFLDNASAGTASITSNAGGVTAFLGTSTAGGATIVTNGGGATYFTGASSGGSATLRVNAGGLLDLAAHDPGRLPAGSLALAGGALRIAVAADGQGNGLALSGPARLEGGTLQLAPAPGNYWNRPSYTVIGAAGSVGGAFAATNGFAFLTPSLTYGANAVQVTVSQSFEQGGRTANQRAVGGALDRAAPTASGDFATVIGALAVLAPGQGPAALTVLGGQPYADFGTVNVQMGYAFLDAMSAQLAAARAGQPRRVLLLAEGCERTCGDVDSPIAAWLSPLGSTGSVPGSGNAATLGYTFGGAAAGAERRFGSSTILGVMVGAVAGTQWVNGFQGWAGTDAVNASLYGSFATGAWHVDGLAGYTHASNRLTRYLAIPGLATRAATGQVGAQQGLGQVEGGYAVRLDRLSPDLSLAPFARLQGSTTWQAGFSEGGADSLSLRAAPQTTSSLRSLLGADLAARIGAVGVGLRLGWLHEYADTSRPLTATFAGAPGFGYTLFGAAPPRDSAVVGLSANTSTGTTSQLYLRYEGEIGGSTNHALAAGLRLAW